MFLVYRELAVFLPSMPQSLPWLYQRIWDAFSLVLHSLVSPVNMFVRQKNVLNALFFIVYPV